MASMARARKAAAIIQPIILSHNHATTYLWPRGVHTHTHTHTYACTHTYTHALKVISRNQAHAAWFKKALYSIEKVSDEAKDKF